MIRKILSRLRAALDQRHGGGVIFLLLFLATALATRLLLLVKAASNVTFDASIPAAFILGTIYDAGAALLAAGPLMVLLVLLPARFFQQSWGRVLACLGFFGVQYLLLFGAVAEWVFWDEFGVRFNFIAVDYLVYTKEVVGNIQESYPMPLIFAGIFGLTAAVSALVWRAGLLQRWFAAPPERFGRRARVGAGWVAAAVGVGLLLDSDYLPGFANNYNRELGKNGLWSLFAAFRDNALEYDQFYPSLPVDDAFQRLHRELARDHSERPAGGRDTLRFIRATGPEMHLNVIQITVESLSADYLSIFNRASKLMPNLEALARKSLVFDQLYATGTRTDRGMEALTLSLPPTPGRSLVKRPRNENLFTLGSVFRSRGYDTAFIYGGYGYFDNMNYFFGHNGYRVVDRTAVAASDVTFANVWGACDEDLYRWTMREADAAHAAGKHFHHFVMTTSNHRPFTYPDGRIDLPSKIAGRSGGVKYTDFAIGRFLRDAETKPWFKDTVFVIVGDHCASVAGKTALPVQNYHIPMLIYAPGGQIPVGHVPQLMSQVDFAPTLLGLLKWSYASRFYGWDVRSVAGGHRALIGNYQKLGLYKEGILSVLMPVKRSVEYDYDKATFALRERPAEFTEEAIAYYQTASFLYTNNLYRDISPEEQARYTREAGLPATGVKP